MSQFSSPSTPPDDEGAAPVTNTPPRRLIPPQERFADPVFEAQSSPTPGDEAGFVEPENPFEAQLSARQRDEMERRHLPPRERARRERARFHVEGAVRRRSAPLTVTSPHAAPEAANAPGSGAASTAATPRSSEQRGRAERDFAHHARVAPLAPARRRRVPRWMKRLLALVALICALQLGFAALTAPQFGIETVEIQGIAATPAERVQPLARALVGQNLVRVNTRATERAIAQLPTVASAKVVRLAHWPPKVALQIRERQPFLKIGAGANWWVVDENGVPFRRPVAKDAALYSAVAPQFDPQLGRSLEVKSWARAKRLALAIQADNRGVGEIGEGANSSNPSGASQSNNSGASAKKTAPARWRLRRIYFDRDGLASLRLADAPHREMLVRLGDDAWPAKLARARQSLAYFERTERRAAELDLVSLERPVWTPIAPQRVVQNGEETTFSAG